MPPIVAHRRGSQASAGRLVTGKVVAHNSSGWEMPRLELVGRLPMIGLDSGAIPGTRPGANLK